MVFWYSKGQSQYTEGNFHMAYYIDMNGYNKDNYDSQDIQGDGESGDPFMAFGIDTQTWAYGQGQTEIGLLASNRIKVDASGYWYWDGNSFQDLLAAGGPHGLDSHSDVVITTPADNEVLAWDNATTKWINQTPAEAGLSVSGHNHAHNDLTGLNDGTSYEHITQTQKNALHSVLTNLTQLATRNHNDLLNINAGDAYEHITQTQKNALHAIYTLEQHNNTYHSTNYKPDFSENTAFNKNFGTLGTEVCAGNDGRLSNARTPTQHNNTYHSVTFVDSAGAVSAVNAAGVTLAASKGIQIDGTPADGTYNGIILSIDTTSCAVYDAVYIDGTDSVLPANAGAIGTMPAIGIVVAEGKVLTHGVVRHDATFTLGPANKVYVATTAGDLTTTPPAANGQIVQMFGITVGADMIFVNPSIDWVELKVL